MTREELIEEFLVSFSRLHKQNMLELKKGDSMKKGERSVLYCIQCAQTDGMKSTEVAAAMNMPPPGITLILNKLEEKGYIKRGTNSKDRRVVTVSLTEAGTRALEEALNEQKEYLGKLTDYLGEADSQEMLRLINRMHQYYLTQNN